MSLTPLDIHHKEFKTARFGGYNEEEVDSFLDQVADDLEKLIQENSELKQKIEIMTKRLQEFEEMQTSLQSALLAATRSAEAVKEQARQEAETVLSKAQDEADSLLRGAQEQARQVIFRAQSERQKMERSFAQLREIKKRYMISLKELAREHLAQVEDLESREEVEPPIDELPLVQGEVVRGEAPPAHEEVKKSEIKTEESPVEVPKVEEGPTQQSMDNMPQGSTEVNDQVDKSEGEEQNAMTVDESQISKPANEKPESDVATKREHSNSNLVDEILALEEGENIYSDFLKEEDTSIESRSKKARKEKRDKHFFWE
ncbi:MAG: DivIVA domain-containing protein [Actinomycetota bacterium]|nr:DivIVA domain-containing protein [Actinomycetota bacterium]